MSTGEGTEGAGAGAESGPGAPHNANIQALPEETPRQFYQTTLAKAWQAEFDASAAVTQLEYELIGLEEELGERSEAQASARKLARKLVTRKLAIAKTALETATLNVARWERAVKNFAGPRQTVAATQAQGAGHEVSRSHVAQLSSDDVFQAMTKETLAAAELSGGTKFSVTAENVLELFFSHAKSHGGKVPVRTNSVGTIDEEGWLWSKAIGRGAPPMSDKLARRLHKRIEADNDALFLVVAPSGAGKSFGAWQLGTLRHVDLLDANRNNKRSLFSAWRRAVTANKLPDALVLKPGETAEAVGPRKLHSRKAVYHAWILFCALTAMRAQCVGPSDWLFLQRHRARRVRAGYAAALAVAENHELHYQALEKLAKLDMNRGPKTVVVVDEASHALPHERDPKFAPLGATTPTFSPRGATGSPAATLHADTQCAASPGYSGAGCGAGAGSGAGRGDGAGAGDGAGDDADDGASWTSEDDGRASHSGLLGCLMQAAMVMSRCTIAMGTSFSFAHATDVAQSGADHYLSARNTHASPTPYMPVEAFSQLSVSECATYIKFYADLLEVDLDPDALSGVCQQLQGRPSFVHYFIMHFVRMPSADLKYIWSHGEIPQPGADTRPECGAKQLLFSRMCAHYTTVVGAMDAATTAIFHALLRVLAAHYVFGGPSDSVSISATLGADHPFDFTDAGLAYLEASRIGDGTFTLMEPLAVQLCAYLSYVLGGLPIAVRTWLLLLQTNLQGTGATGHVFERVVGEFLVQTQLQLRVWLEQLHKVVSPTPLRLPDWCDDSISFTNLSRTVRDDATGKRLLHLLQSMHEDDTTEVPIVFPPSEARPDLAVVPAPSILMLIGCKMLEGHRNHSTTFVDNFESTDVTKLYMKGDGVTKPALRTTAVDALNVRPVHLVRVGFNVGHKAVGSVTVENGEVHVVISAAMVEAAFAGMPWCKEVVRLMCQAGIFPQVQLLGDDAADTAANLQLHVHGFGEELSRWWAAALPDLRTAYDNTAETTRNTVAGVVGIIDSARVFTTTRVRNALFRPDNVAIWKFGDFEFTPEAALAFAAQQKRGAFRSPKEHHQTKHKRARSRR